MPESRFQFLKNDFPEIFTLCKQAEKASDVSSSLLKIRQILEKIVINLGATQNNLFSNINELNDLNVIDTKIYTLFHRIRKVANIGIHEANKMKSNDVKQCLNTLFEITLWFAIKEGNKNYKISDFLIDDIATVRKYFDHDMLKGNIKCFFNITSPLQIEEDFSYQIKENNNLDILEKDVFENDYDYKNRIFNIGKIHLGYARIDENDQDEHTKIIFPKYNLSPINKVFFSEDVKAFYVEKYIKAKSGNIIECEIVGNIRAYNGKAYCDYSTLILKVGKREVPIYPICWKSFPYENENESNKRISAIPTLPLGKCIPERNTYDIDEQLLSFAIRPFKYVKDKIDFQSINLRVNINMAKKICHLNRPYTFYGKFNEDVLIFSIWDKEIGIIYNGADSQEEYQLANKYFKGIDVKKT